MSRSKAKKGTQDVVKRHQHQPDLENGCWVRIFTGERHETRVSYGSVEVVGVAPSKAQINRNVKAGQEALSRAKDALIAPGVKLGLGPEVPLYSADPRRKGMIVRLLKGVKAVGRIVDGEFVAEG